MSAFDMARDMLITPKKLAFAREKEEELFKSLIKISAAKTNEIRDMIGITIAENHERLIEKAINYEFLGLYFLVFKQELENYALFFNIDYLIIIAFISMSI